MKTSLPLKDQLRTIGIRIACIFKQSAINLFQKELIKRAREAMQLGLLKEISRDSTSERDHERYITFLHQIFQEYAAALYLQSVLQSSKNIKVSYYRPQTKFGAR